MSDSRIVSIRKSVSLDPDQLLTPFLYLNPQFGYTVESILRYMDSSRDCIINPSAFPYEIKEYYWIQEGEPGKKSWYALGLLEDNIFFFYKAYTYTSFDKDGYMELWISYKFSDLLQYAMDTLTYNAYITDTSIQNKISDELTSDPLTSQ